jgi:hypothetical protein
MRKKIKEMGFVGSALAVMETKDNMNCHTRFYEFLNYHQFAFNV